MGLDVEKKGWDHGNSFLARDVADVGLVNEEMLKLLELLLLSNSLAGSFERPSEAIGVPGRV